MCEIGPNSRKGSAGLVSTGFALLNGKAWRFSWESWELMDRWKSAESYGVESTVGL